MTAYYNENDKFAAQWLRELIAENLIAQGEVDDRSIKDVRPDDLRGFTQCHFFAGIGGWSLALRLAGWPDDRSIWTGSCPCQPFSAAGKRLGTNDARHLWPQFRRLIRKCRPAIVFGEQVESKDGRQWLSGVCADLEALAYRAAGADLCGPWVGSPQLRQRLYWVADTDGRYASAKWKQRSWQQRQQPQDNEDSERPGSTESESLCRSRQPWESATAIECDDAFRRVGSELLAVANGVPNRMGLLRGYGNAIIPQVAARFIEAYDEAT